MNGLPSGWAHAYLGDLCQPSQYGWTTSATTARTHGLKFLRTTDITKDPINWRTVPYCADEPADTSRYTLAPGDIVISRAGSVGFSAYLDHVEPSIFASYLIRFRPAESMNGRYLAWYLKSQSYWTQIKKASSGITIANVNAKKLSAIDVPVAPAGEQERVVAAIEEQFSRLDAGVAALKAVQQDLRRMTAATYSRMHDAALSASQPRPLSEVCEFIVDGDHNPPKRTSEGVPYLTAKHVKNGRISTDDASFISEEDFASLRRRYDPREGDVLVTCVGTLGEVAVVPDGLIFAADRNLAAMRPSGQVMPSFLEAMLRSPSLQKVLTVGSGSTAQPHLYLRDLRQLQVPIPALDTQKSLVASLHEQLVFTDQLEAEVKVTLTRSERLSVSILAAAFSGRLVRQDGDEEPASILLKRIAQELASSKGRMPARTRNRRTPQEKAIV